VALTVRLMDWLDDRWAVAMPDDWPDRHPHLWVIGTVPLSTWLRHPVRGWQSYRRHIVPLLDERAGRPPREDL
jgi:hypothetical protein